MEPVHNRCRHIRPRDYTRESPPLELVRFEPTPVNLPTGSVMTSLAHPCEFLY